jgi:hypothetical protein
MIIKIRYQVFEALIMQKKYDLIISLIKKNLNTLEEHKLVFFLLIFFILFGAFIRSFNILWGSEILYLEGDDFFHFMWSGYDEANHHISNNLSEVFFGSYRDAHPPLRNLLLNALLRSTSDLTQTRLVAFIPGLILILSSFIFGIIFSEKTNRRNRLFIGLFFALIATVMQELVYLSISTRPYMLMINFQIASLLALMLFFRNNSLVNFLFFLFFAILSTLTTYSANIIVGTYCLVLVTHILIHRAKFNNRKIILIFMGLVFLTGITLFQFFELKKGQAFNWLIKLNAEAPAGDYISKNYISSLKEIPTKFINYFAIFFEKTQMKSKFIFTLLALAYLLGVILLIRKKSFEKAALAALPFLVIIFFAHAHILPFSSNRHCLVLLPSVFISYNELLERILETKFKILLPVLALIYVISSNLFPQSGNYHSKFIEYESNKYGFSVLNKEDYEFIFKKLNESIAQNQLIIIDKNATNRLTLFKLFSNLDSLIKDKEKVNPEYNLLEKGVNFCAYDIRNNSELSSCGLLKDTNYKSVVVVYYNAMLKEFPTLDKEIRKIPLGLGYKEEKNIQNSNAWFISNFVR